MIVGFAEAVVVFEVDSAHRLDQLILIDRVGGEGPGRDERALGSVCRGRSGRPAELALVDDLVVARGESVPLEPGRNRLVADHPGSRTAPLVCVGCEHPRPADVIEVPVGVNDGVDRVVGPGPQRGHHRFAAERPAGIEGDQALFGVDQHHVGERLDQSDRVVELAQFVGYPIRRCVRHPGFYESGRQVERMHPGRVPTLQRKRRVRRYGPSMLKLTGYLWLPLFGPRRSAPEGIKPEQGSRREAPCR